MPQRIRLLALAGGLIQALIAFSLLFLPVFAICYVNEAECRYQSYIQMGGSALGYALLVLMLVSGLLVIAPLTFAFRATWRHQALWVAAISSTATVILGIWSIGLAFLPGGLLLLSAAFQTRKQAQQEA